MLKDSATQQIQAEWANIIDRDFGPYREATLRITRRTDGTFDFIAIKPERFVTRGFYSLLEELKPGDISITTEALASLGMLPVRTGLMAVELCDGPIIRGLFDGFAITGVRRDLISVHRPAIQQLHHLVRVEA